jgi:hypothetical protein
MQEQFYCSQFYRLEARKRGTEVDSCSQSFSLSVTIVQSSMQLGILQHLQDFRPNVPIEGKSTYSTYLASKHYSGFILHSSTTVFQVSVLFLTIEFFSNIVRMSHIMQHHVLFMRRSQFSSGPNDIWASLEDRHTCSHVYLDGG